MQQFTNAEAKEMAGNDADFHRRDLFDAIARGEHPSWKVSVQIMPYEDAKTYRFNPFDLTKTWSHKDYPLIEVGKMRSEEHTSELQSLMRSSYAVFCLKKKKKTTHTPKHKNNHSDTN